MTWKILSLLCFSFCLFLQNNCFAQTTEIQSAEIRKYEGFPPMPFEAPDLNNNKQFLPDYKGKTIVLYFWDVNCKNCTGHLNALNKIHNEFSENNVAVLGMADDEKEKVKTFIGDKKYSFPVIVDVLELSHMAYGGDKLDNPRTFIIDEFGVIRKVLLNTGTETETYEILNEQIQKVEKAASGSQK